MKTADGRYIQNQAQGNLDMNGYGITNASPAINSNDLMTLGQLPQNHFLYMYTSSDLLITNQPYVDLDFGETITPEALMPVIPYKIELVYQLG